MCGIVAYVGQQALPEPHARRPQAPRVSRLRLRRHRTSQGGKINVVQVHRAASPTSKTSSRSATSPAPSACATPAGQPTAASPTPTPIPTPTTRSGICLIHNGIIENYAALKTYLEDKGHVFKSQTDTEVLAMLIGELYEGDLEKAVQAALREVTGAYGIVVMCEKEPDTLVAARKGSPLMVGVGNGEYIVASDGSAIVSHTVAGLRPRGLPGRQDDAQGLPHQHHPQRARHAQGQALETRTRGDRTGRLLALHAEGNLRAAQVPAPTPSEDASISARARSSSAGSRPREGTDAVKRVVLLGPGHGLARRDDRRVPARRPREGLCRRRVRQRVPLPQPDHRGEHGRDRRQPVGRNRRHARGAHRSQGARRARAGRHQRRRLDHRP
jgi:asparagine synthetase B (glutamine-hydrolysing)